uniref:Uncharacterized protein n=1 Tax=Oryza glaberrima TaxID=4538 RepID=I1PV40_ORYGL
GVRRGTRLHRQHAGLGCGSGLYRHGAELRRHGTGLHVLPDTVDMVLDFVEVVQCVLSAARSTLVASSEKPATKLAAKLAEKFECELYIPDMEMLEMNGDTIILPDHVQMKLDKIYNMKKLEDAKLKQDAKKEHVFF